MVVTVVDLASAVQETLKKRSEESTDLVGCTGSDTRGNTRVRKDLRVETGRRD